MSRKKQQREPLQYSGLSGDRAEVDRAFRTAVKSCACPACGLEFTDAAVDWGDAWYEGYVDGFRENGADIRDGPYKLKCEMCSCRSMFDVFANTVSLVPEVPDGDM